MAYRAVFYQPSHFHAALTLKENNPRLDQDIHVYANPGAERDAFVTLVENFNNRAEQPTAWRLHLHEGDDLVQQIIANGHADFVVLAIPNHKKLATIAKLSTAGLPVFADKPWLTESGQLTNLEQALAAPAMVMDIMTIRYELLARLGHQVARSAALFGHFIPGTPQQPAIEITSIHHLCKKVNGQPLRRPDWYYDIGVQGDGMVDIQSHMVEQAQWWILDEESCDFERDIVLTDARRSSTPVPADLFQESTGLTHFPAALADAVQDSVLHYACNGQINYQLCGIHIQQTAEWRQREPEAAGDMHHVVMRGSHCNLIVRQGLETQYQAEVHLQPLIDNFEHQLNAELKQWQQRFPGLDYQASDIGFRFIAPADLDHGHESHFALVLNQFLDYLDAGQIPDDVTSRLHTRYRLLAQARELALANDNNGGSS